MVHLAQLTMDGGSEDALMRGISGYEGMVGHTTREICKACWQVSTVGFWVPDHVWSFVTVQLGFHERVLCLGCFTRLADAMGVRWDEHIELFPVSLRTFVEFMRVDGDEG